MPKWRTLTLHLDLLAWFNPTAVWSDTVLLRGGGLDLESHWLVVWVGDLQRSLDQLGQRTRESELNMWVKTGVDWSE